MLEKFHGPIRSIVIRLQHENRQISQPLLGFRAVCVSIDSYGSDVLSAYEAANGFTSLINLDITHVFVNEELLEAHANFIVRCRLTRILRSHSWTNDNVFLGDLVQVYGNMVIKKKGSGYPPGK